MPTINSPTPDATTTSKGKIQLAGALAGTSAAPTIASGVSLTSPSITNFAVLAGQTGSPATPSAGTAELYAVGSSGQSLRFKNDTGTEQTALMRPGTSASMGVISGTTLGTTGNKSITGLGFTPNLVRFTVLVGTGANTGWNLGFGSMNSASQFTIAVGGVTNGNAYSSTTACISWIAAGSSTAVPGLLASYVSMDTGGFTINVTTASSALSVAWEAFV